jgi:hypothetical protein
LVDLGLAVSTNRRDETSSLVEKLDDAFGSVVGWQVVSGTMVQEVS